jgi:hypothetical protein
VGGIGIHVLPTPDPDDPSRNDRELILSDVPIRTVPFPNPVVSQEGAIERDGPVTEVRPTVQSRGSVRSVSTAVGRFRIGVPSFVATDDSLG